MTNYFKTTKKAFYLVLALFLVFSHVGVAAASSYENRFDCDLSVEREDGNSVTISWENSRVRGMILEDERGHELVNTFASDRYNPAEDEIEISEYGNKTYILTAWRYNIKSGDTRVCEEEIEGERSFFGSLYSDDFEGGFEEGEDVLVVVAREQLPLTGAIAIADIPYTGFEAGSLGFLVYYGLLAMWSLVVAYLFVIYKRARNVTFEYSEGAEEPHTFTESEFTESVVESPVPAPVVMSSIAAPVAEVMTTNEPYRAARGVPSNLPTGEFPFKTMDSLDGAADAVLPPEPLQSETSDTLQMLEEFAHERKALVSTDALMHIATLCDTTEKQCEILTDVIDRVRQNHPSEDGWTVVNKDRIALLV